MSIFSSLNFSLAVISEKKLDTQSIHPHCRVKCAFCFSNHEAIHCWIYATQDARKQRQTELKLWVFSIVQIKKQQNYALKWSRLVREYSHELVDTRVRNMDHRIFISHTLSAHISSYSGYTPIFALDRTQGEEHADFLIIYK